MAPQLGTEGCIMSVTIIVSPQTIFVNQMISKSVRVHWAAVLCSMRQEQRGNHLMAAVKATIKCPPLLGGHGAGGGYGGVSSHTHLQSPEHKNITLMLYWQIFGEHKSSSGGPQNSKI